MPQATEEQFLALTQTAMNDRDPFLIMSDIASCFLVLSALQLAWRRPGLSPIMADILRDIGATYEGPIITKHPEVFELIEAGWNLDMDVPHDET